MVDSQWIGSLMAILFFFLLCLVVSIEPVHLTSSTENPQQLREPREVVLSFEPPKQIAKDTRSPYQHHLQEDRINMDVFIGQVLQIPIPKDFVSVSSDDGIPNWVMIKKGAVVGIPGPENMGSVTIKIQKTKSLIVFYEINVIIETTSLCNEKPTSWLDTYWEEPPTLDNKLSAVRMMQELDMELDENDTMRVYPVGYANSIRKIDELKQEIFDGNFMVIFTVSCSDLRDAVDALEEYLDLDNIQSRVRLSRGYLKQQNLPLAMSASVTKAPTTKILSKTTIPNSISPKTVATAAGSIASTTPIPTIATMLPWADVVNDAESSLLERVDIPHFTCMRGALCEMKIPMFVFGENDTNALDNTLDAFPEPEVDMDNWIHFKGERTFIGYSFRAGHFTFYISKQNPNMSVLHCPISIKVLEIPTPNHIIQMDMNRPSYNSFMMHPHLRIDFMEHLAYVLRGPKTSLSLLSITRIDKITRVVLTNNTIESCDSSSIQQFAAKVVNEKRQAAKKSFVNDMQLVANIRRASLVVLGSCPEAPAIVSMPESLEPKKSTAASSSSTSSEWHIGIKLLVLMLVLAGFICVVTFGIIFIAKKWNKLEEPAHAEPDEPVNQPYYSKILPNPRRSRSSMEPYAVIYADQHYEYESYV